uniref:Bacterial bifunctional deaminase-reductase C-terminal domain-containing protein n=1 Tax=Lotharella globosa TaxID=91324 RepID=A0A6V3R9W5_9EUKA|mmetsp:Transcript_18097/g.34441  ORF Transcript_18097/g.34441 Transcript_18097/m.34441 type:complete len:194 (+) Transcript_18097:83-664(+)
MESTGKVRVYIACSLDGFIAGPKGELDWLEQSADKDDDKKSDTQVQAGAVTFEEMLSNTGCMLMGRTTYDTVVGFGPEMWAYGDIPVHVLTHRELPPSKHNAKAVSGSLQDAVQNALAAAKGKDVYVDGGSMIRQALDAGLVDDMIITMIPIVLGKGISLFAGASQRHPLEFYGNFKYNQTVQLHARPIRKQK